ncbi:uncharacterized protein LOC129564841 [Sitodiplosis mosellana]|uniref:uncharacterized protein LOC129564841 n=1 Tax=Sitodiplosis mosellana TaxID=263140 RepID=UPI00244374BE|nr:uncharacterized protein LOC129564841 [Sitodiplosis mosellana]
MTEDFHYSEGKKTQRSRTLLLNYSLMVVYMEFLLLGTYDVSRPTNFTEPATRQNDRTKRRRLELDEERRRATENYHRTKRRHNNPNASGLIPKPTTLADCYPGNFDSFTEDYHSDSSTSVSSSESDHSDNYSDYNDECE